MKFKANLHRTFTFLRHGIAYYGAGSAVIFCLLFFYAQSLWALFSTGSENALSQWAEWWQDAYLQRLIRFSFGQALLSSLLSCLFGLLFARAFFYLSFKGKSLILRLLSLTFVLPALVAIFGLLGIYGVSGWLSQLFQFFGLDWQFRLYGLSGILMAHLFFNIPLAARMGIQALNSIPSEQFQLATQLNLRGWRFFRLIEWAYLKQQLLPTFALIFMLCFTSFTIVLTLGGGPQYSTLEVAIYQAVFFEFDLPKAALFALIQFAFCLLLFGSSQFLAKPPETYLPQRLIWRPRLSVTMKIGHGLVLISLCLFLLSPLLNTLIQGVLSPQFFSIWQHADFWQALGFTLLLAPTSALLALLFSLAILLLSRRLQWRHHSNTANLVLTVGMIILAIPTLILSVGLFLSLQSFDFSTVHLFILVVLCNALAAMPFVIRILNAPMYQNLVYYEKLCLSLNLTGWQRFRLIEWANLKSPIKYAFALAAAVSLGDFTAIALFGSPDFTSLPRLLYQQLGQYQTQEAAVTAFVLLLLCVALFFFIEQNKEREYD